LKSKEPGTKGSFLSRYSYKPSRFGTKPIFFIFFLAVCAQYVFATGDSSNANTRKPDYYLDYDQRRIDLLDGKVDNQINLGDSATTAYATKVYFTLIDSLQKLIEGSPFPQTKKKTLDDAVYAQLLKINLRTVSQVKRYDNLFRFMLSEINAITSNKLFEHLITNIPQSLSTIELFKNESCADSFLVFAAYYRPDLVFSTYPAYAGKVYALHVLEECSKIAPVTVKRYFNPGDKIYEALKTSSDTAIKIILEIKEKYTRRSNAFTLLDDIVRGKLSLEDADAIGNKPERYLRAMLRIRAQKNPLAVHSLEDELEIYSLKFVRVLNDLHNEKDEVRFESVKDFSAGEMYTLMVYSEEEIFTSTFNGLFNRLMTKLGNESGSQFLDRIGNNRFRTFIKMAAGFGKLKPFLQSMTALHQQMLMIKFASGLEAYNDLSQAVEVADAFASINDSLILKILRGTIKYEYVRFNTMQNSKGTTIYGLLSNLFVERNISSSTWFASVSQQYSITNSGRVSNAKMFDKDNIDHWLIYFYDDEDGDASFSTFLKTFTDKNWRIADSVSYVLIKSTNGKAINIYANKPKHEYDGQEMLESIFNDRNYAANVMVHRGHSYYAFKTIEKIKDDTQVFILGSCGGYHSISSILERSPDVGIVSSKQIGTLFVNNPMLKLMAEYIREGKDLDWQKIWAELDVALKNNPKAYERFLDYIPPHKNLGAIFIKAYNKMVEQE
jgi:hypothetical protein